MLGIGGSACTDGGTRLLQALGASLRDRNGRNGEELQPGGGALAELAEFELSAVCGRRSLSDEELRGAGIGDAYACSDLEADADRCMAEVAALVERLGRGLAEQHLPADGRSGSAARSVSP